MAIFELEPNNSLVTATQWNFSQAISGQLSTYSDIDLYKVNVSNAGIFTLSFDSPTNLAYSSVFEVAIFNSNGGVLSLYSTGKDGIYNFALHRAGEYIVAIGSSISYSGEVYSLSGSFQETSVSGYEWESNDTVANADVISLGGSITGQLFGSDDLDIYKVSTPSSGIISVIFDSPTNLLYSDVFEISLISSSGVLLNKYATGADKSFYMPAVSAGDYYIKVKSSTSYSGDNYVVTANFLPGSTSGYEYEANDFSASANILTGGQQIIGQLSASSDKDFYSFNLASSATISISFDSPTDLAYSNVFQISLYDSTGLLLNRYQTGKDASYSAGISSAGTYYVEITSSTSYSDDPYGLTVSFGSNQNRPPVFSSSSLSVSTNEDALKSINFLATDADNDALTYSVLSAAAHGTTSVSGGTVTYTPSANYNGSDTFVVTASDGKGGTATQTVNIAVTPVNDAPTFAAASQSISANAGTIKSITLSATDVDGDSLVYTVTSPTKGTATISGNVLSYTPGATSSGSDTLAVTASDGKGGTATQTINVTVISGNNAPTFSNASLSLSAYAGTAKSITVSATDVDGDALTYTVAAPGKGTASISGNTLTYTPSASAAGSDSFVVSASDGKGGTANQTISVTISAATAAKAFTVYTASGWAGAIGGNGAVYGTNGFEDVRILYGQVSLDGSFNRGGDILRVAGNADAYVIGRTSASSAYIESTASKVSIPIGSAGMGIVFADGVRSLVYSGGYKIGGQTFTVDPAKITATADSTVLPSGADPAAQATIYMNTAGLSGGTAADITVTGKAKIMGTNQADVIKLGTGGVDLVFDGSFNRGGDIIVLDKAAGDYSAAKFNASTLVLTATGEKLTIPLGTVGMTLRFTDGDRTLVYKSGAFYIGDQTITSATATALTPSSITLSADQGVPGSSVILDATGKVIFTDDAAKSSNIILKNFGTDDVIRVTGASASQYNFAISDADPKDLEITYTDPTTSATNTIVLDDVIKTDAFIASYQTAATALGWNFMTFG